uniref:Polypeptide N-acetylgalactosaminyltransferase n=1 Tax=Parastrongyloides trichosuri TaxID=131310 RepID=A0A0N4Z1X0_PARTI
MTNLLINILYYFKKIKLKNIIFPFLLSIKKNIIKNKKYLLFDKVSLDRSIPDVRSSECKEKVYDLKGLPKTSVIIIFTDEAWSPLLRTVHSVFNRSPEELLHEIILYDDFSQREELHEKLELYIKRFGGVVKLYRAKERKGLIRAKVAGARHATGEVIVFLDSHCEANAGWLEPIVYRIKENRKAIICPTIDHISAKTMQYSGGSKVSSVGGFHWSLHFTWDPVPEYTKKKLKSDLDPVPSPTMAGGLLAANREFFFEIGSYDEEMDIWGGENLEISFRTWMCGGSIEFLSCSHVGHIFRDGHPYNMTGRNNNKDVHGTNSKRLAEVWMDDYKEYYYRHRNDLRDKDVGDLTERHNLRKKLNCKSFEWYLDNVIPYKFIPHKDVIFYGAVSNKEFCLDTLQRKEDDNHKLGIYQCQEGASTEAFTLQKNGNFRREESCIDSVTENGKTYLRMVTCVNEKSGELFEFKDNKLISKKNNLCLDFEGTGNMKDAMMMECENGKKSQVLKIKHFGFP